MKKYLSFLFLLLAGSLPSCTEEPADNPIRNDKWLIISPSSKSLYAGDEYIISPTYSSDDVKELDFVWSVTDSEIVSIVEDNNSTVTVRGEKPGSATIRVECPGETKRLSATLNITFLELPPEKP